MDKIAGEVGFYQPLFVPAVELELAEQSYLTFDGVQRVRDRVCPEASYQASLIACVNRSLIPTILLEAAMAYKKSEAAEVRSGQTTLFASAKPVPKLRAVSAMQNDRARAAGFTIHPNIAVPAASIVAKYHSATEAGDLLAIGVGEEDLAIWRHSDGKAVGFGPIRIETHQVGGCTYALVQKLEPIMLIKGVHVLKTGVPSLGTHMPASCTHVPRTSDTVAMASNWALATLLGRRSTVECSPGATDPQRPRSTRRLKNIGER